MTKQDFDVIVIGAGPAGAAAAASAARDGLRVALIDRKSFPREKLCGGLVTGRAMRYLRDIFGEMPEDMLFDARRDFEFQFQGQSLGHLSDVPPVYLSMRYALDDALVKSAIALGAEDWTGEAIAQIDRIQKSVRLESGRVLTFGVLVGADGVNSLVARHLFGQSFDRARVGFGLEVEAPPADHPNLEPVSISIAAADWGYGWRFPKNGSTTIGVGGVLSKNADMKAAMSRYLTEVGQTGACKTKGQFLPFGDYRRVPGKGNVLLAGDAAGLVDPITGEGIAYAMKSGQLAALAAKEALRAGRPETALPLYQRHLRPIHRSLRLANLLRPLIFNPAFQAGFVRAFRGSDRVRRRYMDVLAGDADYGAILAACLFRAPRLARYVMLSKGVR